MDDPIDVHTYFGLTYANYMVLHRTIMQSLPIELQYRLTSILDEVDQWVIDNDIETADSYMIRARDKRGKFIPDPIPPYNKGRTIIGKSNERPNV